MDTNQTIAQKLQITDYPFVIHDKNGNEIYSEQFDHSWEILKYDDNCEQIYYENSDGLIVCND